MPVITCDSEHIYHVDGVRYDGVTEVLRAEGFMGTYIPADLDWYLERGKMIHKATELWDKGTLDESTVDERIRGYLESWKKFRRERIERFEYAPEHIEIKLHDPLYGFAGTLDRPDLDIKSGAPERWHIFQIAAYNHLARVNGLPRRPDRTVYLDEDGEFPLVKFYTATELRRAAETFLCALNVYRAKKEMGVS